MTILAEHPPIPKSSPTPATVLLATADLIDALPHYRMSRVDLHLALCEAGPWHEGQAALEQLAAYLTATGGSDRWLHCWSVKLERPAAAAQLRAAAEYDQAVTR